jgi:DNA topoisomerase-2
MHLFDANDKLKKYETIIQIIDDYYETRLQLYETRKNFMIKALDKELLILHNKKNYITENIDGTIDLRKKKKEEVVKLLEDKGYNRIEEEDDYKYLVKMTMDCVTEENVDKLFKEHENISVELQNIKNTTIHQMWNSELTILEKEYVNYKRERCASQTSIPKKVVVKKIVKK